MKIAALSLAVLSLDAGAEAERIERSLRESVMQLHRRGIVVALSGGIDSSVVGTLAARAVGADRVIGVLMPEADSSPDSLRLGQQLADSVGIRTVVEDISGILAAAGCYRRRNDAIREAIPEYDDRWRSKIVVADVVERGGYPVYSVVARSPTGEERRVRLSPDACLGIVSATNFKQRTRKMLEYYYADRFLYAVAGTPNRLEHDLGFFVKQGDGAADVKPIAHLYKTQVYQLARYLGVPEEIQSRRPTTDTYSLDQSQEEFYFGLSLEQTDLCLHAIDREMPPEEAADGVRLTVEQARRAYDLIRARRQSAQYLNEAPLLMPAPAGHT